MRLKSLALGAVLGFLCLSAAVAQEEPQVVRQNLMKGIGQSMGALGAIAKGEKPYDASVVETSLETIRTNANAFADQFPDGSETGMESDAAPAIWENKADFEAKALQLAAEADTLLVTPPQDQAGVGAALKTLGGTCGECHQTYRLKR